MAKWRLVFLSLPAALIVVGLRYLVHQQFDVTGALSFGDIGPVITGAALIMGLMLGGVISDYKEAEKLPAVIGGNLLAVEMFAKRGLQAVDKDNSWIRARVAPVAHAINDWFYSRISDAQLWAIYEDFNQLLVDVSKSGVTVPYMSQLHGANNGLGGAIDRASHIRNTSYVRAGYALMEFLTAIVIGLLVICDFAEGWSGWLIPGALGMIYVFMILFIKDLDNPFGYGDNNGKGSAADVDITPWVACYKAYL